MKNRQLTIIVAIILLFIFGFGLYMSPVVQNYEPQEPTIEEPVETTNEYGFKEISMNDALNIWKNKQSGVILMGFKDCPWCQEAYPVLDKIADSMGINVLYVKTRDDEGERLYTDEEREELYKYMPDYMTKEGDDLTLYVPILVKVSNGVTVGGHVGTVDGHDAHERTMTTDEIEQLSQIYTEILGKE